MNKEYERVLISKEEIAKKVDELGLRISKDYEGKEPLFIGILKGSVFFFSDLLRALRIPAEADFMAVSSYGSGSVSSGEIRIKKDLDRSIEGRDIILIEDIIDTGNTLYKLRDILLERKPASVRICTFLDKPSRRVAKIEPDYVGFSIPDEFVVGYGLDYAEQFRMGADIYVLKREVYEK